MGGSDPMVQGTVAKVGRELSVINKGLARARAGPTRARLEAEVAAMRPAIRRWRR
jgi:hypothetical protein